MSYYDPYVKKYLLKNGAKQTINPTTFFTKKRNRNEYKKKDF